MAEQRLNERQRRFIEEYLVDLNATQAAIRAGYSSNTAKSQGQRLLTHVDIQAEIKQAMDGRSERTKIEADEVLKRIWNIANANMRDYITWGPGGVKLKSVDELTEDQTAAVAEVSETITEHGGTKRIRLHDKMAALDKVAKHLGMYLDRRSANIKLPAPETSSDSVKILGEILGAIGKGELDVNTANMLSGVVEHFRKTLQHEDFDVRLKELERQAREMCGKGGTR